MPTEPPAAPLVRCTLRVSARVILLGIVVIAVIPGALGIRQMLQQQCHHQQSDCHPVGFDYATLAFVVGIAGFLALLGYRWTRVITVDASGIAANRRRLAWADIASYQLAVIAYPLGSQRQRRWNVATLALHPRDGRDGRDGATPLVLTAGWRDANAAFDHVIAAIHPLLAAKHVGRFGPLELTATGVVVLHHGERAFADVARVVVADDRLAIYDRAGARPWWTSPLFAIHDSLLLLDQLAALGVAVELPRADMPVARVVAS